ncbi:MAG: alpha/beta fold hydrolase [Acidimicrobiales bacterium]
MTTTADRLGSTHADEPLRIPSSDGVTIALHPMGGSGPELIICHATGVNGGADTPLARALTDDFRVWAIDFRGHGHSTPPPNDNFAWGGMTDDLLACIDTLGTAPVRAFGHSLGGAVTLLAEAARPGSIAAAYLYEPIVLPAELVLTTRDNPMIEPALRRREVFASKAEALERYASRPPLSVLRADSLAAYVDAGFEELPDGTVRLRCRPENEARTFACEQKMTLDRIDDLSIPVTVGAGKVASSPNPADFAPPMVERLRSGRLLWYEHLGHFGPLQTPEAIAHDVREAVTLI